MNWISLADDHRSFSTASTVVRISKRFVESILIYHFTHGGVHFSLLEELEWGQMCHLTGLFVAYYFELISHRLELKKTRENGLKT